MKPIILQYIFEDVRKARVKVNCASYYGFTQCNHFSEFRSYLIPLVVQVADDGVGFVHELFPFVERRRERAERGAALPVPLDDVLVHGHLEVGI